jgi:hypothetical protein
VSLETFRRDGRGVRTPVWVAPLDGRLVIVTAGASYKVRRLRADPRVRVAACDARGRLRGPWHAGRGRVLDDAAHASRAHRALRGKYGWQMLALDVFSRLGGRIHRRAFLEIAVDESA